MVNRPARDSIALGLALAGPGHPVVLPPDGRDRPFDALDVFERCVEVAARKLGLRLPDR
jgi:hypothetical protein